MGNAKYTKGQVSFVKSNYLKLSIIDIASKIGITEAGARYILDKKLKIKLRSVGSKSKTWSEDEIDILRRPDLSDYQKAKLLPQRSDSAVRMQRRRLGFKSSEIVFNREFESDGYKHVRTNGKYKREHRLVCEERIGRELKVGEVVHHIDGVKLNNEPGNLFVCSRNEHNKAHNSCFGIVIELMQRDLAYFDKEVGVYRLKDF